LPTAAAFALGTSGITILSCRSAGASTSTIGPATLVVKYAGEKVLIASSTIDGFSGDLTGPAHGRRVASVRSGASVCWVKTQNLRFAFRKDVNFAFFATRIDLCVREDANTSAHRSTSRSAK
jgi:hypothetical protein